MMSKFWDKEKFIGEIEKNGSGNIIRVEKVEKDGKQYIHSREWYPAGEGQYKPTKKGEVVPVEAVEDWIALLQMAKDEKL